MLSLLVSYMALAREKMSPMDSCVQAAEKYEAESDLYNAAFCYSNAVKIAREVHDNNRLPELLLSYGLVLNYLGDYSEALMCLEEAEDLLPADDNYLRGRIMSSYGSIYFFMGKLDESLTYYNKALSFAKEMGSDLGISISLNNVGCVYEEIKEYDKAIEMFNQSLVLQDKLQDSATICNTYYNVALCYYLMGNSDEAYLYFERSKAMAEAISDVEITSMSLQGLAKVAADKGRYDEAETLFNRSEKLASDNHYRQVLLNVYREKRFFYEERGLYREAYQCIKMYSELSDSIFSEDMTNRLNAQRVKYEIRDKEQQIESQKKDLEQQKYIAEVQEKDLAQQRFIGTILILAIFLLLVVVFLVVRIWRIQRARNAELLDINSTKDRFISIISHDLKNPAIAQRNAMQAICDNFDSLDSASIKECCCQVLQASDEQVKLIFDLLNWSQMEVGRMPYNPIDLNLREVIENVVRLIRINADNKNISIVTDVPDECIVYADRNMLETVLRNLLSNAIKFSHEQSKIHVSVADSGEMYEVSVLDNGVGISHDRLKDLFSVAAKKSTIGTKGETGNGLGLVVCEQMVKKNGGSISVESEEGKYTKFNFTICKSNAKATENSNN